MGGEPRRASCGRKVLNPRLEPTESILDGDHGASSRGGPKRLGAPPIIPVGAEGAGLSLMRLTYPMRPVGHCRHWSRTASPGAGAQSRAQDRTLAELGAGTPSRVRRCGRLSRFMVFLSKALCSRAPLVHVREKGLHLSLRGVHIPLTPRPKALGTESWTSALGATTASGGHGKGTAL